MKRKLATAFIKCEDYFRVHGYSSLLSLRHVPLTYLARSARRRLHAAVNLALYYPRSRLGHYFLGRARELAGKAVTRSEFHDEVSLIRSAVIKPYTGTKEPGFIVVSFEHELAKLASLSRLGDLLSQYRIVFLPTWQPFYSDALCLLDARATESYFLMPSAFSEESLCQDFSSKCHYLPFHAASWVRQEAYEPPSTNKDIDILMIANFSRYKRHWVLFEALRQMPEHMRVVIAGVPLGSRTKETLMSDARIFGVDHRIDIVERATDQELRSLLKRARLFCAMTYKEGAYIAVAEALMAGVPVAMFSNAIVGTKAYVTHETGFLLSSEMPLSSQLMHALEKSDRLRPQSWARKNISAEVNSAKLNVQLQQWSMDNALSWTRNIDSFYCEHFEFRYFDEATEVVASKERERLRAQFGLTIEEVFA